MDNNINENKILIAGLTPYFLEKPVLWFQKNSRKIAKAHKINPWWNKNILFIEESKQSNPITIIRKFEEMGYEQTQYIEKQGQYSRKGGIIDIFPISSAEAWRLEFRGNLLERLAPLKISPSKEKKTKLPRLNLETALNPGDYITHINHGIGIFKGFQQTPNNKYFILEYAQKDKLLVPIQKSEKISPYIGFTKPKIHGLGGSLWKKTKQKVKESAIKLANDLLKIYSKREIAQRDPYIIDNDMEEQLVSTFPYQETADQINVLKDIDKDLAGNRPMDRLLCADVGFGKTEIAIRSALKAVANNKQVALIAPTTILAYQHFNTFKERFRKLPVSISLLTRFISKSDQRETVRKLKEGKIDIVIGTHRLLSNDIKFNNLGLLIIDEEQRFGVKQKEKLKNMRSNIDILSMTATPIPRTLHLGMAGLRDISVINTPPFGRTPIKTYVMPFSEKIIRKAVLKEIERGGQIYFLHNRVETIGLANKSLAKLLPDAKIGIAHGKLPEQQLIEVIGNFRKKKTDLLLATTIIENGLDFPNVNTLIVSEATRLGLAQAHQIRGRIGRGERKAYAYFLYKDKRATEQGLKRLEILKQYTELGAGYEIAMKDLEMRGAGNVLGKEQSGRISQVGLNIYCQMLADAVIKIKKHTDIWQ